MKVRQLVLSALLALVSFAAMAQEAAMAAPYRSFTPKDQWELGIHAGVPFILGDVDAKFPGFGGGIHIRKAFDHIFSVRVVGLYAQMKNEETSNSVTRTSDNDWISGSAQLVAALNNFRFDKPNRKILLNGFLGLGVDNFKTTYRGIPQVDGTSSGTSDKTTNAHVEVGLGLAFRVNKRFNIGIEHTVMTVFGPSADLLDSDQNLGGNVTSFRDVLHYPHLSLNFNLGKSTTSTGMARSEPLYWVNPITQVTDAITALEARPIYNPTDTDGDGIIDDIDDEDNSPAGARVNTRGVMLDSDGDKVPDYLDKEPFSPPGYSVNPQGVANVPKPISEDDVNRIVDAKIAAIKFPSGGQWFLPMVTFANNHYDLSYDEYEKLYQVGTVMMQNPDLKVVAIGHTDKRGTEGYNNVLSYNRAKATIDFLVAQYGISRDRLILNWVGENGTLIPVEGANEMNRRVEFRVVKGETEMSRPEGPEAGKAPMMKMNMKANKASGY